MLGERAGCHQLGDVDGVESEFAFEDFEAFAAQERRRVTWAVVVPADSELVPAIGDTSHLCVFEFVMEVAMPKLWVS